MSEKEMAKHYSKDWCEGFCRLCGTSCAHYSEDLFRFREENARFREALEHIANGDASDWVEHSSRKTALAALEKKE